ncbi:unnamed protein product, partial [Acanthoscelides obtectus]
MSNNPPPTPDTNVAFFWVLLGVDQNIGFHKKKCTDLFNLIKHLYTPLF